ncbi:MAG: hypothetical protein OEU46_21400 [Alphaproteobacteria bacterium]|nr:hypothetical protein [Alphaproteobacteria bacterium]
MADLSAWIIAAICIGGCLFIAGYNGFMAWSVYVKSEHAQSIGPVFGGLMGFIGLLIAPIGDWTGRLAYAWIPLLLDVGCLPYLTLFFWDMVRNRGPATEMTLEEYQRIRRSRQSKGSKSPDE